MMMQLIDTDIPGISCLCEIITMGKIIFVNVMNTECSHFVVILSVVVINYCILMNGLF